MVKSLSLILSPEVAFDGQKLSDFIRKQEKMPEITPLFIQKIKQSIDARKRDIKVVLDLEISYKPFDSQIFEKYKYD